MENVTQNYDEVISRDELLSRKEPIHVGGLVTVLSVNHCEDKELRKVKALIVFRKDDFCDENTVTA